MTDFSEIVEQYNQIKDTPEVTDTLRTSDKHKASARVAGGAADSLQKRQRYLPDAESHYKLEDKYSKMFDKSSRAGAKSTLNGLVLPSGRKNFSDFHDNFTGTGRFKPQKAPDKVQFQEKAPKIDPYPNKVILYERCPDCCERVDKDNFIPGMTFVPNGETLSPQERQKWASVDIKPETLICYLFCVKCPTEKAKKLNQIKHDPVKSQFTIGVAPDGKPWTLADKESQEFLLEHTTRVSEAILNQVKYHRDLNSAGIFYGNADIS